MQQDIIQALSTKGYKRYEADYVTYPASKALAVAWQDSKKYNACVSHIEAIYNKTYGASITVNYPVILSLEDACGNPLAALGVRFAATDSPLFLERYFDTSIEQHIQGITDRCIRRDHIAEVGNLASTGKNNIAELLYGLACFLDQHNISTILFTGTSLLKRYLNSIGLYPTVLTDASPLKLGNDAQQWGSYYQTNPKVMLGSVLAFRKGLESYFNHSKEWVLQS